MREFLLALIVVSGPLKSHLKLLGISLPDVTILASIVALLVLMTDIVRRRFYIAVDNNVRVYLGVLTLFLLWIGISSFWSLNNRFWLAKFGLFLLPVFVSLYPALCRQFDTGKFYRWLFNISAIVFLMFVYYFPRWRLGLLTDSGLDIESYKTIYLGVGILASLNLLVVFLTRHNNLLIKGLKMAFLLNVIFLASARAATLFVVLSCLIWAVILFFEFIYQLKIKQKNILYALIILAAMGFVLYQLISYWEIVAELANHSITRFSTLFQDNKGASISSRFEHIELAFHSISSNWMFGIGLSSYSDLRVGLEVLDHPHNMFIEVWLEQGLIGLVLLVVMLFIPVYSAMYRKDFMLLSCLLFLLAVSLTAFSYVENRVLFGFMGLAFLLSHSKENEGTIKS